jgi:hypothetical protein
MKKIILGFIIGAVTAGTVSAFAAGKIISAEYNDVKVFLDDIEIPLENPLVSIVNSETSEYFSNYMPMREILEKLGYTVYWKNPKTTAYRYIYLYTDDSDLNTSLENKAKEILDAAPAMKRQLEAMKADWGEPDREFYFNDFVLSDYIFSVLEASHPYIKRTMITLKDGEQITLIPNEFMDEISTTARSASNFIFNSNDPRIFTFDVESRESYELRDKYEYNLYERKLRKITNESGD